MRMPCYYICENQTFKNHLVMEKSGHFSLALKFTIKNNPGQFLQ
jgi:hypothetical protein